MPVDSLHFSHAHLILPRTAASTVPSALKTLPKYLNPFARVKAVSFALNTCPSSSLLFMIQSSLCSTSALNQPALSATSGP
ncbi:hypothetical protein Y032_0045g1134 [Ancylostoma ceylanicum]|uniref:Uncharacterized protein n=1 Tax=Ancylostoma ceylanicum TaxID=53326 RepID=A0A016UD61_9BILA|nr:hypothetical protein Y032_0045g1134 [Ancylostoma ceylanicum]